MRRFVVTLGVLAGGLAALRSWRARRADAQLWEEATRTDEPD